MMHDAPHAWTLAAKGPMTKHKGVYVCEEDLHKVCTSSQHCDPPPATHACVSASRWLCQSVCVCVSPSVCFCVRRQRTDSAGVLQTVGIVCHTLCPLPRYSQLSLCKDP
jgi:hypothetical protein